MESSCIDRVEKNSYEIFTQNRKFNFFHLSRKMVTMNINILRITLNGRIQEYFRSLQYVCYTKDLKVLSSEMDQANSGLF
jgi:hypothetical protein